MYSKILLPIDTNHEDVAIRILTRAKALLAPGGTILATHVVPEMPAYGAAYVTVDLYSASKKQAQQDLGALIKKADVTADVKVEVGVPHTAILRDVEAFKPDLVIIGSHKPGLADYFLGSTAARVVRHAGCSVLVDR